MEICIGMQLHIGGVEIVERGTLGEKYKKMHFLL